MSEDTTDQSSKTEPPSEKKINDALEKGQTPFSREISSALGVCAIAGLVWLLFPVLSNRITEMLNVFLGEPGHHSLNTAEDALEILWLATGSIAFLIGLAAATLLLAGLLGSIFQTSPRLIADRVAPNLSHISLQKGFQRLFSLNALFELAKAIVKLIAVCLAAYFAVNASIAPFVGSHTLDPTALPFHLQALCLRLTIFVAAVSIIIAVADFIWTYHRWHRDLRMSRQELKDEFKQSEGDGMIKSRLRSLARSRLQKQMISNVPKSSFVVANPTHYAVALLYTRGQAGSPRVMAKGQNLVALKIRALAEEHRIPVIENKLLAKAMYDTVKVDQEIPREFYRAVAEIVMMLSRR